MYCDCTYCFAFTAQEIKEETRLQEEKEKQEALAKEIEFEQFLPQFLQERTIQVYSRGRAGLGGCKGLYA